MDANLQEEKEIGQRILAALREDKLVRHLTGYEILTAYQVLGLDDSVPDSISDGKLNRHIIHARALLRSKIELNSSQRKLVEQAVEILSDRSQRQDYIKEVEAVRVLRSQQQVIHLLRPDLNQMSQMLDSKMKSGDYPALRHYTQLIKNAESALEFDEAQLVNDYNRAAKQPVGNIEKALEIYDLIQRWQSIGQGANEPNPASFPELAEMCIALSKLGNSNISLQSSFEEARKALKLLDPLIDALTVCKGGERENDCEEIFKKFQSFKEKVRDQETWDQFCAVQTANVEKRLKELRDGVSGFGSATTDFERDNNAKSIVKAARIEPHCADPFVEALKKELECYKLLVGSQDTARLQAIESLTKAYEAVQNWVDNRSSADVEQRREEDRNQELDARRRGFWANQKTYAQIATFWPWIKTLGILAVGTQVLLNWAVPTALLATGGNPIFLTGLGFAGLFLALKFGPPILGGMLTMPFEEIQKDRARLRELYARDYATELQYSREDILDVPELQRKILKQRDLLLRDLGITPNNPRWSELCDAIRDVDEVWYQYTQVGDGSVDRDTKNARIDKLQKLAASLEGEPDFFIVPEKVFRWPLDRINNPNYSIGRRASQWITLSIRALEAAEENAAEMGDSQTRDMLRMRLLREIQELPLEDRKDSVTGELVYGVPMQLMWYKHPTFRWSYGAARMLYGVGTFFTGPQK